MKRISFCFFLIVTGLVFLFSCNNSGCNEIEGIRISKLLQVSAKNNSYRYCDLVEKSLKGEKASLKTLSLLDIGDAAGYDHGIILVKIIQEIGSTTYLESLGNMSEGEKQKVKSYLEVGVEYGEFGDDLTLKEMLPKVYGYLIS